MRETHYPIYLPQTGTGANIVAGHDGDNDKPYVHKVLHHDEADAVDADRLAAETYSTSHLGDVPPPLSTAAVAALPRPFHENSYFGHDATHAAGSEATGARSGNEASMASAGLGELLLLIRPTCRAF